MKPKYTVRLTGELDQAGRQRVAERVAGVTDIGADKIERLLERGEGKDLIKPSSANVANRLASVLAEAGAPVQLVPVTPPEPAPPEPAPPEPAPSEPAPPEPAPSEPAPPEALEDEDMAAPSRAERPPEPSVEEAAPVEVPAAEIPPPDAPVAETPAAETPAAEPADEPATTEETDEEAMFRPRTTREGTVVSEPELEDARGVGDELAEAEEPAAAPPEPPRADTATSEPAVEDPAQHEPDAVPTARTARAPEAHVPEEAARRAASSRPPARPEEANGGNALLGAIGAALLGIGAFLAMDVLTSPIGIGILVLAALSLGLSVLGQRRAIWLPGAGALTLLVWALANAEAGVLPTLASNWEWFAMFAGAALVIVAGAVEARRGYGP